MQSCIRCSCSPCTEGQNIEVKDSIVECADSENLEGGQIVCPVLVTIRGSTIIGSYVTLGNSEDSCACLLEGGVSSHWY